MANTGLEMLKSGKSLYFDWKIRREIYNFLNADSTSIPSPQRQSLAIQTVEFVMPLFVPADENDLLAFELLDAAKAFSENRVTDFKKLDEIQDAGYHSAQWFGYNHKTKQRNFQSAYAGAATYQCLIEVRYLIDEWQGVYDGFTDKDCMSSPCGDTAVQASFAYSTSPRLDKCQPELVYKFWEWWINVAVQNAINNKRA